ncbi:MAG: penicillin-binding transpeptidase domain-containing protein, partial [Actinomycetota bacterium]|nr:penicillin-binding transpeptidase domain-containing protein [Actinomycetota bacterium]
GTAEKANKNGAGYDEGRVITSFIGYAPYEHPQAAILIVIDEPEEEKMRSGAERLRHPFSAN